MFAGSETVGAIPWDYSGGLVSQGSGMIVAVGSVCDVERIEVKIARTSVKCMG